DGCGAPGWLPGAAPRATGGARQDRGSLLVLAGYTHSRTFVALSTEIADPGECRPQRHWRRQANVRERHLTLRRAASRGARLKWNRVRTAGARDQEYHDAETASRRSLTPAAFCRAMLRDRGGGCFMKRRRRVRHTACGARGSARGR